MTETRTLWSRVISRTLKDRKFKARLLADPAATLKEAGVAVPDGVAVKVHENSEREVHLVLPLFLADDALSEAELVP